MKKSKIFVGFLIAGIVIFLTSCYCLEYDYFWHIKAGEYMFNNGILTHDVFSWVTSGKYWMSHEWLFEIILYVFKLIFGNYHVIVYSVVSLALLFFILFFFNREGYSKNVFYTLFYLVLFQTMFFSFVQARPHLFSYSLIALTVYLCFDLYKNKESKKIYFLPLITILWANIHGGSSNLSYLLCGLFLVCGLFSFKFKKIESERISKKQIYKYLLVMVLCMIGVCINVHGFKMFIYPYENILDTTMINNIDEWKGTSLHILSHYIYYIYLLFIIMTMLFSSKKIKFIDFVLLLFVSYLGLKSIRFWLYSPIVMSFAIFDYVKEIKVSNKYIYILSIFIPIIIVCSFFRFKNVNLTYKLSLNTKLVSIIKEEKPQRLFNMYNYGGELIYNDIPVFIDGRADLYSKYNFKDYLNLANLSNDYENIINKYNFDYLLIDRDSCLNDYLSHIDNYESIYKNKKMILYKKTVN